MSRQLLQFCRFVLLTYEYADVYDIVIAHLGNYFVRPRKVLSGRDGV